MTKPQGYLQRIIVQGPAQQGFSVDVKFWETEELLKEAIQEAREKIGAIWQDGKIIVPTEKGPRAIMTVADLFSMLGIKNIIATATTGEVHGAVVLAGRAPVIIQP